MGSASLAGDSPAERLKKASAANRWPRAWAMRERQALSRQINKTRFIKTPVTGKDFFPIVYLESFLLSPPSPGRHNRR